MLRITVGRALAATVLVLLTGWAAEPLPWSPPAPATSAREAVQHFLSAVVDGRRGDAAAVLSPEATAGGVGGRWLEDPPPLTDIRLGCARPDRAQAIDDPRYTDVTFVPVTFYLNDFSGDDGFPGGETGWGYIVADTPDEGWLILGAGMV